MKAEQIRSLTIELMNGAGDRCDNRLFHRDPPLRSACPTAFVQLEHRRRTDGRRAQRGCDAVVLASCATAASTAAAAAAIAAI